MKKEDQPTGLDKEKHLIYPPPTSNGEDITLKSNPRFVKDGIRSAFIDTEALRDKILIVAPPPVSIAELRSLIDASKIDKDKIIIIDTISEMFENEYIKKLAETLMPIEAPKIDLEIPKLVSKPAYNGHATPTGGRAMRRERRKQRPRNKT
jgi:hypothetical protein